MDRSIPTSQMRWKEGGELNGTIENNGIWNEKKNKKIRISSVAVGDYVFSHITSLKTFVND